MIGSRLLIIISCIILPLFVLSVAIRKMVAVVHVLGESMSPTLEPGDRVLVMRHWPTKWLRKGHIVLVWPEYVSNRSPKLFKITPFIKRIVALGGEPFPEDPSRPFDADTLSHQQSNHHQNDLELRHIPQDHLFVCGDNPAYSFDSRVWGSVALKRVLGVTLMKLPSKTASGTSAYIREANR